MREVLLLSHELRTPLSVISGYLELLDEEEFTPEERRQMRSVIRGAVANLNASIELLIARERRVASTHGLTVPDLIAPATFAQALPETALPASLIPG